MWALSEICFSDDHGRPMNLVGTWEDLEPGVQDQVLDLCVSAMCECEPTPIPVATAVPGAVLFEAWCFRATVVGRPEQISLDANIIGKWLPALLHWSIYWDASIIDACVKADLPATEAVFCATIERELRLGIRPAVTLSNMPDQLWTGAMRDRLGALVSDLQFAPGPRGDLLDRFAQHEPAYAIPIARRALEAGSDDEFRKAALNVLLRQSPDDAWPFVRSEFQNDELDGLLLLGQLYDLRNREVFSEWSADRLMELASMLFSRFPLEPNSEEDSGWVTPVVMCRQLRDAIPSILFDRGGKADREQLAKLVAEQPQLQNWYDRALSEENSRQILGVRTGRFLPLQAVLDILANADFRFVQSRGRPD